VVSCVKRAFEVRIHDVDVFVVESCVFHRHDDGREGVVGVAVLYDSVMLVAEDPVGFGVFRARVLDK
jgi:hypothetical protein